MEMHQLRYFVEICKRKSFTQAAESLRTVQSCLSSQIKKLEIELGVELFNRVHKNISLTESGNIFLIHAQLILKAVNNAEVAMKQFNCSDYGFLRIGALPIMSSLGITRLLAEFMTENPNIHLELREDGSNLLMKALINGEIDVAFITAPQSPIKDITIVPLIKDELVAIIPRVHPLAAKAEIDISELQSEPLIFMKPDNGMYTICVQACKRSGFEPNIFMKSSQVDTIMGLVDAGIGITLISSRLANATVSANAKIVLLKQKIERITAIASLNTVSFKALKKFKDFSLNFDFNQPR